MTHEPGRERHMMYRREPEEKDPPKKHVPAEHKNIRYPNGAPMFAPDGTMLDVWFGPRHLQGYGQMKLDGRTQKAHRLMYEYFYEIRPPDNLKVCHTCDNPSCVRPNHLFLGTQLDNVRDCIAKGRMPQCAEIKPPPATKSAARNRLYRQRKKERAEQTCK